MLPEILLRGRGRRPSLVRHLNVEEAMAYTLEQLSQDVRRALKDDPGPGGKKKICEALSRALLDKDLVASHVTADLCKPRKVLYEDPELGFCICGHVYADAYAQLKAWFWLFPPKRIKRSSDPLRHSQIRATLSTELVRKYSPS